MICLYYLNVLNIVILKIIIVVNGITLTHAEAWINNSPEYRKIVYFIIIISTVVIPLSRENLKDSVKHDV